MKKRRAQTYEVGDLIAVPVKSGGYAVALIARWTVSPRRGYKIIFTYVFDRLYPELPKLDDLQDLRPTDAIWVKFCGDAAIPIYRWTRIGPLRNFRESDWPECPWRMGHDSAVNMDVLCTDVWGRGIYELAKYVRPEEHALLPPTTGLGNSSILEWADEVISGKNTYLGFRVTEPAIQLWKRIYQRLEEEGELEVIRQKGYYPIRRKPAGK